MVYEVRTVVKPDQNYPAGFRSGGLNESWHSSLEDAQEKIDALSRDYNDWRP
jgi:hypothetical protein